MDVLCGILRSAAPGPGPATGVTIASSVSGEERSTAHPKGCSIPSEQSAPSSDHLRRLGFVALIVTLRVDCRLGDAGLFEDELGGQLAVTLQQALTSAVDVIVSVLLRPPVSL
jgi:hypothetical protein